MEKSEGTSRQIGECGKIIGKILGKYREIRGNEEKWELGTGKNFEFGPNFSRSVLHNTIW